MNKNFLTRIISFVLAAMMILTSLPINTFAEAGEPNTGNTEKKTMNYDNTPIGKEQINGGLEVKVAKPADGKTAKELVKNPDMPKLYTLRADYKVQRGDNEIISYQPYIVTVGDYDYKYTDQKGVEQKVLSDAEKAKINKYIDLPELDGYSAPTPRFHVNYKYIKDNAEQKNGEHPYVYNPKPRDITVRHVFQHLDDIEKYGGEGATKEDIVEVQSGLTGAILNIQALDDDKIQGYEPESNTITTQVPESNAEFEVVFRYNRKHYNLVYDTKEGTPIPSRTVYFEQVIPALADVEIPKKIGAKLVGWKPSKDIEGSINNVNKIYEAGEVIKDNDGNPVLDLKANLKMPASDITFTAVWEDNEKADYAIQFWAEKADHADGASLMDKYDYMGTRVYENADTGFTPNLEKEPIKGIKFPDLDQARLAKIWAGARINRGRDLYLNKFFVYNKKLTDEQNKDEKNPTITKTVSATGQTVYNIYYDRQVYDLYFTKSNAQPDKNTIYPEIWGYDKAQGEAVMLGGPGKPYHYKARFNEMMYKWPNDAKQTKGFTPGYQSFGWGPNYTTPNWPLHLDTPPYRLNADEFIDMANYTSWGGYTKHIDKGDGTTKDLDPLDFTTLSFGIKQDSPSIPHHMDFWMDGFKKDETIIRYDLVRTKADTAGLGYGHRYPKVLGFTPYGYNPRAAWPAIAEGSEENGRVDEAGINDLNDERNDITPNNSGSYYNNQGGKLPIGQLDFIPVFFSDSDEFGDVKEGGQAFTENGYLRFKYTRNKYPLRFNYDPSIIRDDSYFNSNNQLDTFYEFPLKALSPDVDSNDEYKKVDTKEGPKNLLDNPENLQKLGLKDLVFTDPQDNKLKVKRPDNISDKMVFKGWALDPAGTKLIWQNKGETMPFHPLNLYAKWGEPDYKWKVTFDPNGGELQMIDVKKLTAKMKTIQEGDIGQEEIKTYPEKGYNGKELPDEKDVDKEKKPQVFTVIQRQKLIEPKIPKREGYDFMGWEFVRYKKDDNGEDTDTVDTSYRDTYKVPELYSFGNDVVSNVHLKAIWVKNNVLDIKAYHHFLDLNFDEKKVVEQRLPNRRAGSYTAAVGSMQGTEYLLIPKDEWEKLEEKSQSYRDYKELTSTLNPVGRTNTYTQVLRIEPTEIKNPTTGKYEPNPDAKVNVFHFYYRPFRKREYKVNYIDERGKEEIEKFFRDLGLEDINNLKKLRELLEDENFKKLTEEEQEEKKEEVILDAIKRNKTKFEDKKKKADFEKIIKKYQVIGPEVVINGNRDYDARNYRKIAGWKLTSDPQQQLFFNVGKDNEFLGINGTGADQVFFYYKDVRVIEVPKDGETPEDYVRVTFKADKGGFFKDKDGKEVTELYYDVIKGLKSQLLPVPKELGTKEDGTPNDKEEGKYYITPDNGKKFLKWDNKVLLNKNTVIEENYTFIAYFDWSDLKVSSNGIVTTESFKDNNPIKGSKIANINAKDWSNNFAPTIDDLKKQLNLTVNDKVETDVDTYLHVKFTDENGKELKTDDDVLKLLYEQGKKDKDELVRTVNIKVLVKFKNASIIDTETLIKNRIVPIEKETEAKIAAQIKATEEEIATLENQKLKEKEELEKQLTELKKDSVKNAAQIKATEEEIAALIKDTEAKVAEIEKEKEAKVAEIEKEKEASIETEIKKLSEEKTVEKEELEKQLVELKKDSDKNAALIKATEAKIAALREEINNIAKINAGNVDFGDDITTQKLDIPVKVYKNVYEALTGTEKPLFLSKAEKGELKNITGDYVKVTVAPTGDLSSKDNKVYYVNKNAWVEIPELTLTEDEKKNLGFTNWSADKAAQNENQEENGTYDFTKRHKFTENTIISPDFSDDVIPANEDGSMPDGTPQNFVKVTVKTTDKATNETAYKKVFWVNPAKEVRLPAKKPIGKDVAVSSDNPKAFTWVFTKWTSEETPSRAWGEDIDTGIRAKFDKETIITANYDKSIHEQGTVVAEEIEAYESTKGINDFIPTEDALKAQVKVIDANGTAAKLPSDAKVELVLGDKSQNEKYASLEEELYDKLKEKDNANDEPTRIEKVKAKVTFANGEVQEVEIPIKVIKNIYEAKTLAEKPYYVPKEYVRVVLNPTSLATDPQKTYFYVNPQAKVVIPGNNPKGVGDSKFIKWTMKADSASGNGADYTLSARHQFTEASTITAQYSADVVPQEGNTKPDVPENFVEIRFVPTDKAQDTTEKIYWVNPAVDVKIPIENPKGTQYYTFKEWKIGDVNNGETYNPETPKKFEKATTITATYNESKNIIPYNPSATDPMARPEGYVRVTFAADEGLKLTEQKAYYVKKNAGITLGNAELVKPGYKAETGYEFEKWDKEDTLEIKDQDVLVTAKATALPDYDTTEHPGYKKVTFVADANGEIRDNGINIDKKVYYVNPNKYVNLPAPTPVGDTGYEFSTWSKPGDDNFSLANFVKYEDDTTITAKFNLVNTVIPIVDGETTKPKNFVKVTFKFDANSEGHGTLIGTTEYYVDSTQKVVINPPAVEEKTGYKFKEWTQDSKTPTQYTQDTIIECKLDKLDDIIKAKEDGTDDEIPQGYVLIYFYAGPKGTAKGQAMYYVNPDANKTIGDLTKPNVTANAGYEFIKWDTEDSTIINKDQVIYAKYKELPDKILVQPGVKQPEGYVKVTFEAGDHGKIDAKAYYVNPNKYVQLDPPETRPDDNYEFSLWDPDVRNFTKYEKNTTITARFRLRNLVTPNVNGIVQPANTIKVTFKIKDDDIKKGSLDGVKEYYVVKNTEVTINPPRALANVGYEFEKWDKDTTKPTEYTQDTVVEASFIEFDPVLPSTDKNGIAIAKPRGYIAVHFLGGEHGLLSGETTYYVNPNAGIKLESIKKPSVIANTGYKFSNTWDVPDTKEIKGTSDIEVTAQYVPLPDIITAGPTQTAPKGYVVIIFKTDGNGTMTSRITDEYGVKAINVDEIVYFVNPNKNIKLTKEAAGPNLLLVPDTKPNDNYVFDEWFNDIDSVNPIIRGRVHVAKFKPAKVKLTYDANGAEGNPPAELEVNYNTSVRLAGQGNLNKKDKKFLGWKIGDDTNLKQAGDEILLTKDKKAVAQWEDEDNIIKYNPEEPITRPKGYVRVMFISDDGLSLSNVKYYYVKADKGLTLKDIRDGANYGYPSASPKTGYKFDKWDKDDTLEINTDIKVEALSTPLADTIEKVDENTEKPSNYVEVKFVAGENGKLKDGETVITEKIYYVNPTKYVTITPPTSLAKGDTGYEFGAWDKDATIPTVYKEDATITGSFNGLKEVIPKISPDGTENKQPEGYKTVTFVIEPATGGKIVDGEVTVYYVNPAKDVTVPQPKPQADTGYEFEKWDQDTTTAKKYVEDVTVKGNFKKLDDIIPSTDENRKPNAKPEGYITVTFDKGTNGKSITGQTVYYVNPKADPVKTLGDPTIVKPEVKAETGYKFTSWSFADTKEILSDITVIAQYKEIADVIPKTTNDDSEKPEGYITVTFVKGDHGELEGNTVFYVNPNKAVVLENKAPTIKPNTGYTSAGWDTTINTAIQYKDGDKITALYNELGDVIPQEKTDGSDKPAGYLTVTFDKGANGELSGKTVYYVKPNKKVTVPAPTVTPSVGFEFEKWDKELTQTFTEQNTTITAKYDPLNDIIPQKKTDGSDRPNGYFTVTFEAVNGSLEGTTVYYVKPNVDIDLTNTADAITKKANIGFTDKGGTWDKELKDKFKDGDVITFNFKALDDVIPKVNPQGGENKIPEGYVTVKFTPTANAVDPTEKVYFVNPKANVTILVADPVGKEVADASGNKYTFNFKLWTVTRGSVATWNKGTQVSGQFIQDTDITAKYNVEYKELIKGPVPKDNVVTGKGDVPNPEDLIKNIFDPNEPNNKDNLPDGTTFTYTNYGKPDVNNLGKTTAKVEVRYPNGKTTVVKVPITVVDYVVPQIGGEKPLVPDSYVKVTVDTTETATPNTRFVKVFWVKPGVEVTLPDILAPTGKTVTNLKTRVTNTNNFIKWKLVGSNPEKFYENEIMDTFTAKESTIVAVYEFNDNIKPVGKNNQLIPKGSDPDAKDFINNPYNDKDPKNKDNLPPGTKFEFVPGTEPDTREPGENKQTTIKVIYPNGEVKEVPVIYNVSGDVVEQTDPNKKPDVPDNFVEVVVDTTDFAKGDSYYVKTYWVNPENIVTIPATIPKDIREGYAFDYWQVDLGRENGTRYRKVIEDRFVRPTYIKACYYKVEVPKPGSDYVVTDVNVFPNEDEYRSKITPPKGKKIARVKIMDQPDVSKPGTRTYAEIEVVYTDGTSATVTVQVYVQRPGETNTRIVYRDRIVEKEKIVEKIIKIKDNQRLKEVRFMQGFEGKFRPHDGLTRAEAAQILANALKQDGYTYNPAYPINYKDVKQKWYTQAIVITTQANVFKGYDDGYFRPEEKISRAEWIATLKRFQQLKDADGNKMGLKANHWATKEVEAAYEEGWLQIYTNGNAKFNANEPITREEVAAVTNKAFGRLIDRTYIMRNDKSVINYKDINPSMWSYVDILCASNSFIHDENVYMSHGIEYIKTIVNNIEGTIIFNVQLKNLEIIQDKFQRYLR